jgi:hypothetical protein
MTARRGFALLPTDVRVARARQGGVAAHVQGTAHEWTKAEAAVAGAKGGKATRGRPVRGMAPQPDDTLPDKEVR